MAAGGTGGSFSGGLPPSGQSSTSNTSAGKGPGQPQGQNPLAGTDAAGKGPGQPQVQPAQTTTVAPGGTTGIDPKLYQQLGMPQVQQPYGGFPHTAGPGAPPPPGMLTKPGTLPPNMSPYAQQFMQGQNQLNGLGQQIGVAPVQGLGQQLAPGQVAPTQAEIDRLRPMLSSPMQPQVMPPGSPAPFDPNYKGPSGGAGTDFMNPGGMRNPPALGLPLPPGDAGGPGGMPMKLPAGFNPTQPQIQPAQSNIPDYMRHQMQERGSDHPLQQFDMRREEMDYGRGDHPLQQLNRGMRGNDRNEMQRRDMGNRMDNDKNEMQRRAVRQQGLAGLNKATQ
jgi:hypothetical protein